MAKLFFYISKNILYYIGIFEAIYYSFIVLGCVKVKCIWGFSTRVIWGRWFQFDEQDYLRNDQQDISSISPSWLQVKISFIITLKKYASKCLVFLGYIPPKGTCLGGPSLPQPMMGGRLISSHGMCLNGKLGSMLKTQMSDEQKPDCLVFFLGDGILPSNVMLCGDSIFHRPLQGSRHQTTIKTHKTHVWYFKKHLP